VSAGASSIVANPSTLTGSIGVFGGKFAIGDGLSKLGIDVRDIAVGGDYSSAFSEAKGFTPTQRAALSAWIDQIYNGFIVHVASNRKIPVEQVQEIAKGRVWTGEQAKGIHLVDKTGGFYTAVDEAKALAKLDRSADIRLVTYSGSGKGGSAGSLTSSLQMAASGLRTLSFLGWAMSDPKAEAVMDKIADQRLREEGATVLAPKAYEESAR
jgi:protease-4